MCVCVCVCVCVCMCVYCEPHRMKCLNKKAQIQRYVTAEMWACHCEEAMGMCSVCMCVCVCVCVCACVRVCTCAHNKTKAVRYGCMPLGVGVCHWVWVYGIGCGCMALGVGVWHWVWVYGIGCGCMALGVVTILVLLAG